MSFNPPRNCGFVAPVLALMMAFAGLPSARANVYATNIKLNGGNTNLTLLPGDPVTITYILNEPASLGVTMYFLVVCNALRSSPFAHTTLVRPRWLHSRNGATWRRRAA